jgi:predicted permease
MSSWQINLIQLYLPLISGTGLGWLAGVWLPKSTPLYVGQFLFWVGVPIGIIAFLRGSDLSGAIWIAPVVAWVAIGLGAGLAWVWLRYLTYCHRSLALQHKPRQGSFLLSTMVGNTGYLGYPVTLALVGQKFFAWALFYDLLGTTLGAYGLGVLLAAQFGTASHSRWQLVQAILKNPALWSFAIGLLCRDLTLPPLLEQGLHQFAWSTIALSLVLIGMRLSQLTTWSNLPLSAMSLSIKMIGVPLLLGLGLLAIGIRGLPHLVIVLQMAMPPAFATLVLAEVYDLDRDLAVTTLAIGSLGLLITLPLWLWLFGTT